MRGPTPSRLWCPWGLIAGPLVGNAYLSPSRARAHTRGTDRQKAPHPLDAVIVAGPVAGVGASGLHRVKPPFTGDAL